jgi:hypothetical protein
MASAASVTVSIAEEQSGICKRMPRVNCVEVSVSAGSTSERAGTRRMSSKVNPSIMSGVIMVLYCYSCLSDRLSAVSRMLIAES